MLGTSSRILITGCAGFIGFHLSKRLLEEGYSVAGIDNVNSYYDISLKEDRLKVLSRYPHFSFIKGSMENLELLEGMFEQFKPDVVVHLAAQAGVRYSLTNPHTYIQSNLVGFFNILECCKKHQIEHLLYASSSSVYGLSKEVPFSTTHSVDCPISLYAATKKSNELMAHTYSHLYGIQTVGLRFFTVYGPWGRPDMAMFKFTKAILEGKPIDVYNHGQLSRDFTYIDDIISGVVRLLQKPDLESCAVFNIGHGSPVQLMDFINAVEVATGLKANCNYLPMQPGDVEQTWADTQGLFDAVGYKPDVPVQVGAAKFVDWYRSYYKI